MKGSECTCRNLIHNHGRGYTHISNPDFQGELKYHPNLKCTYKRNKCMQNKRQKARQQIMADMRKQNSMLLNSCRCLKIKFSWQLFKDRHEKFELKAHKLKETHLIYRRYFLENEIANLILCENLLSTEQKWRIKHSITSIVCEYIDLIIEFNASSYSQHRAHQFTENFFLEVDQTQRLLIIYYVTTMLNELAARKDKSIFQIAILRALRNNINRKYDENNKIKEIFEFRCFSDAIRSLFRCISVKLPQSRNKPLQELQQDFYEQLSQLAVNFALHYFPIKICYQKIQTNYSCVSVLHMIEKVFEHPEVMKKALILQQSEIESLVEIALLFLENDLPNVFMSGLSILQVLMIKSRLTNDQQAFEEYINTLGGGLIAKELKNASLRFKGNSQIQEQINKVSEFVKIRPTDFENVDNNFTWAKSKKTNHCSKVEKISFTSQSEKKTDPTFKICRENIFDFKEI